MPTFPAIRSQFEPTALTYVGLFLTTLSLLQLELFLTRIFSVTMWYHFAFMAISLAMFGLAAGAVLVEVMKKRDVHSSLANIGLLFAVSSAVCFTAQLYIPADPESKVAWTVLAFVLISIPFVFGGMAVCVALTRFPAHTGSLYAADLAGSAAGCVLTIPILNHIHAPTAVILNAAVAALAAVAFALQVKGRVRTFSIAACVVLLLVSGINQYTNWIDIKWIKGGRNWGDGLYEKWNALSRIYVRKTDRDPFGWGMSPAYEPKQQLDQLYLNIDSGAATVITKFDGQLESLEHLKYDVTALAHHVRQPSSVLVIGVGGGRDILTSLVFGHRRVVGVEINRDILDVLTNRFSDYAGKLQQNPAVTLVNDEARSYVARTPEKFGIIQASLIDTWAASSAGAYVLTENGLYTREAWRTFLDHLAPDGILTMSRWYYEAQPAETLRLAALATTSLVDQGIQNPRRHVMIIRKQDSSELGQYSVATILVSRQPFTDAEMDRMDRVAQSMEFVPVLTPRYAERPEFEAVVTPGKYRELIENYPLNIEAPTDDTPFFFHMLRATDLLKKSTYQGMNQLNLKAEKVLATLLSIVIGLSTVAIIAPLALRRHVRRSYSRRLMVYFAAIGLAFMMVEIGQLERLIVFLGHPIYGLTVVLFVLLIASSLGSLCSHRFGRFIWLLPILLGAFVLLSPSVTRQLMAASTPVRILVSALLLFPPGFFMGMAFPLGVKQARYADGNAPTAWYWGINGAFSVISSVLALVVAVFWGVTVTLLVGLLAYVVALAALQLSRKESGNLTWDIR
jgi:SAM-dependent methyltransferase